MSNQNPVPENPVPANAVPANAVPATNSTKPRSRSRESWIDCARWLAMFMVVICHACDPFNCAPDSTSNPDFLCWGAIWGSMLRPCVPLFVMMTGALLLPIRETMGDFYKKRISRVAFPFLIWSVIYTAVPLICGWFTSDPAAAQNLTLTFFPYAGTMNGGAGPGTDFASFASLLWTIPFTFSHLSVHLWYVYMLIGLYLYLPIFSAWVERASNRAKLGFLAIWGIALLIPYFNEFLAPILPFGHGYLFGACSWNAFGLFYAFAGFNGYLLLGHVIAKISRERKFSWPTNLALVAGTLFTFVGFLGVRFAGALDNPEVFNALAGTNGFFEFVAGTVKSLAGTQNPAELAAIAARFQTDEMVELFWTYCTPNVVISSAALFLLFSQIRVPAGRVADFLATLGKIGFGVYLVHYLFVGPSYILVCKIGVPVALQVPASALFAFVGTYILVFVCYKFLPKPRIWLG